MRKKLLAMLLTVLMIFTMIPVNTFAAEAEAPEIPQEYNIVNGSYDANGVWSSGGNGTKTYEVNNSAVNLSKTATHVEGNTYEITLNVETSTNTVTTVNEGAVVLVIDISNSMKYCADCGGEPGNYGGINHVGNCSSTTTRMAAAKSAARSFLASYAGTEANADRQLAIVTFCNYASTVMSWKNVAGGAGKNSYDEALGFINGISTPSNTQQGGTNLEAGLENARDLLSDINAKAENVVLLTDGQPTLCLTSGNGYNTSKTYCDAASNKATAIKNAGGEIYTICYGVAREAAYSGSNITVSQFLRNSVASSKEGTTYAYDADNASDVAAAFAAISSSITNGIDGAGTIVTDPLGDYIEPIDVTAFTGSGSEGYIWELSEPTTVIESGTTKTYIYELKYKVELDVYAEGFDESAWHPTNDVTTLKLTDGTELEFPVPAVKGSIPKTQLTVEKIWEDLDNNDGFRPDEIQFILIGNGTNGYHTESEPITLVEGDEGRWTATTEIVRVHDYEGVEIEYTVDEIFADETVAEKYEKFINGLTIVNTHESEKVSVAVEKIWDDMDDHDGFRPDTLTVKLYANGKDTGKTVTLSSENGWSASFSDLFKYEDGVIINYTVAEVLDTAWEPYYEESAPVAVDGGYQITNKRDVEFTEISVEKIWDDNEDQDGLRADSVTVNLYADGAVVDSAELTEANSWKATFNELSIYKDGKEIVYTIDEAEVAEGYEKSVDNENYKITNTHKPAVMNITAKKEWVDDDNRDGLRTDSVTVILYATVEGSEDKVNMGSADLTEENDWTYEFKDLPVYLSGGKEVVYTVEEVEIPEGYSAVIAGTAASGFTVTNTHESATTKVEVTKVWEDNNNQDGKRPESITVELYKTVGETTEKVDEVKLTDDYLAHTFEDLYKFENGKAIKYTVKEVVDEATAAEYTTELTGDAQNGFVFTNTHEIEKTSVGVVKVWVDDENNDGFRPEEITVTLYADGEATEATAALNEANGFAATFEDLDVYKDGEEIAYTVVEAQVEGYLEPEYSEITDGVITVTNTREVEYTEVKVEKVWEDNENIEGFRPEAITVNLLANGEKVDSVELSEANSWNYTFENLSTYKDGTKLTYSVEEIAVENYTVEITGDETEGFVITNTRELETVEVEITKVWEDDNDRDGLRPEFITVELYANGGETAVETLVVEAVEGNVWTAKFTDLNKYANGEEIVYTIKEVLDEETTAAYETEIAGDAKSGFEITNTHEIETTEVEVKKEWVDDDNRDGLRTEVKVILKADGEVIEGSNEVLNEENAWTFVYENLPVYRDGGVEIEYTVEETEIPEGYVVSYTGTAATGFIVTNTHEIITTNIVGTKTWNDDNNRDGIRPEEITVNLIADGEEIREAKVKADAEGNWKYKFKDLPVYRDGGIEIKYEITEDEVESYETSVNNFDVTNTHNPELVEVEVEKQWVDDNDRDGIRPDYITVELYANDAEEALKTLDIKPDENGNWKGTFTDLYKYENGVEIVYTVKEVPVEGYETKVEDKLITNTHTPETTKVEVNKVWVDDENRDGLRPAAVTINLYKKTADTAPELVTSMDVKAEDNWAGVFENLYVYENGEKLIYTIDEVPVEGYEASVDGFTVTNTHEVETRDLFVEKVWNDADNNDGIRPTEITVSLLANDEEVSEVKLSLENNWYASFENLPVNENGEEIEYTFVETEVKGYKAEFSEIDENGEVILTNTHEAEITNLIIEKVWEDGDNNDGLRTDEIAVQLYANGEKYGDYVVLGEANDWTYVLEGLPVFSGGKPVVYTVLEAEVDGYEASYSEIVDGKLVITNTHEVETVEKVITKVWEDQDNAEGKRPDSVTIEIYADGELMETVELTAETEWKYTLTGLKYEDGVEITYTIKEVEVPAEYEAEYDQETLTVTNTLIKKVPQTGDYTDMSLFIVMAAISLIGFGATFFLKKKEN